MKFKKTAILVMSLFSLGGFFWEACSWRPGQGEGDSVNKGEKDIAYYTCPMHPQIHQDHSGECPICHMTLVPVYKESMHRGGADQGGENPAPTSVIISPERQQVIGVKTAVALRKQAIKEIRTVGRAAFDPELAIAQREFLGISRNVPSLKKAAVMRLKLLGMSDEEIRSLEKRRTVSSGLYLPGGGDPVWVYASLYQEEAGIVPLGSKAVIALPSGDGWAWEGEVRGIDPVVDTMTRSIKARIEVPGAGGHLRPDAYVNVSLKIDLGQALLIPKSAVIETGTRKVVLVVQDGQRFFPREVKTGAQTGDEVVVLEGINEGEKIVESATFLVDSESRLKSAVSSDPMM